MQGLPEDRPRKTNVKTKKRVAPNIITLTPDAVVDRVTEAAIAAFTNGFDNPAVFLSPNERINDKELGLIRKEILDELRSACWELGEPEWLDTWYKARGIRHEGVLNFPGSGSSPLRRTRIYFSTDSSNSIY
jgi:hypothetical protein